MAGTKNKNVIKRSVSFSPLVNQWAEEMAAERGYSNFSAFLAELVREAKDNDLFSSATGDLALDAARLALNDVAGAKPAPTVPASPPARPVRYRVARSPRAKKKTSA